MSRERVAGKSNMSTARVCHNQPHKKLTKQEAARKLARLVEADMERKGLSEAKKNDRIKSFVEYVDCVNANRAK
jgi:hypothetical protein